MNQDLFYRIAEELGKYHPKHISPYLMSDPLTDPHIFLRINILRTKCPDAFIELSTTPELITSERIPHIIASPFSEMRISMPTIEEAEYAALREGASARKAIERIRVLLNAWRKSGQKFRLTIVVLEKIVSSRSFLKSLNFWKRNDVPVLSWPATSRAGNVCDIELSYNTKLNGCSQGRDTHWFHIAWDGSVVLCCMDYGRKVTLGSVCERSILEIWQSANYQQVRRMALGEMIPPADFPCISCEWGQPSHVGATCYMPSKGTNSKKISYSGSDGEEF